LVIEIPGANFSGVPDRLNVNKGAVTYISLTDILEKKEKQIEVRLSKRVNYQVSKIGSSLVVDIEKSAVPLTKVQSRAGLREKIARKGKPQPQARLVKKRQGEYIIGGRDVLEITVYDEPDLDRKVRVSNRGYISFPLIGNVKVAGLSAAQMEEKLESLLKRGYLINPQISVNISEYRSNEIYVLGAVNKAGAYPLMGENNLLEALSRAGGIATTKEGFLASKELYIIREELSAEEGIKYIRVDLNRLLAQGDLSLNIPLKGRDTIYVPQVDSIFVYGEVNSPGSYKLLEKEVTVLEAVTRAGGLTKYAAANRTKVIRYEGGVGTTIKVDLKAITKGGDRRKDVVLKPGDVVIVPQSYL
jgi:polysaccharide export outer membrane protein